MHKLAINMDDKGHAGVHAARNFLGRFCLLDRSLYLG